jgi:hypothetical protein
VPDVLPPPTTISTEPILSIASASFGKPGLEHVPDLGPCPRPDRAKSPLGPSLASITYRRVLQLLSQPAVEVQRVCPGRQSKGDGAEQGRTPPDRDGPRGPPPATLAPQPARGPATTSWPIREPADPVVEPSIVARGPPCPRAASAGRRRDPAEREVSG